MVTSEVVAAAHPHPHHHGNNDPILCAAFNEDEDEEDEQLEDEDEDNEEDEENNLMNMVNIVNNGGAAGPHGIMGGEGGVGHLGVAGGAVNRKRASQKGKRRKNSEKVRGWSWGRGRDLKFSLEVQFFLYYLSLNIYGFLFMAFKI